MTGNQEYQKIRTLVEEHPRKTQYFQNLLLDYLPEMRLVIRGGKLTKTEGWRNVVEHQAVEIVAIDVLCDMLGIEPKSKKKLMSTAAYHDWNKRIELGKIDEAHIDKDQIKSYLDMLHPDQGLLDAVEPGFLRQLETGHPNLLQLVMFYVDDITFGSTIMPLRNRLTNSQDKNPDWERELKLGEHVESQLADLLNSRDIPVYDSSDIPTLVLKRIKAKMDSQIPSK